MTNRVRNTTREAEENPLGVLAPMLGGTERFILEQERNGQHEIVASAVLPVEMGDRAEYERMGIVFGERVKDDPLFIHATLPAGWKREGTNHAMWSHIVDDKGRKRISIFYKAAYYDRRARMSMESRFTVEMDYDREDSDRVRSFHVLDAGKALFESTGALTPALLTGLKSTDRETRLSAFNERDAIDQTHAAKCSAWLDENRPGWKDRVTSWDLP